MLALDKTLLAARGAAIGVWLAAAAETAAVAVGTAKYWGGVGRLFANVSTPSELFYPVVPTLSFVVALLAPASLIGSLGVAVWVAGDIWVRWAKIGALGRESR